MDLSVIQLEAETRRGYALRLMATFGQNVRRAMEKRGLEAKELADILGVKQGTLSDWMRDRRGLPEGPTLLKFAKALNWSVEELLEGVDHEYQLMLERRRRAETAVDGLEASYRRYPGGDVEDGIIDVSGHTLDDIPVIAEGEASPQGSLFWTDDGKLASEVEDRITRPFDVKDPRA